jgi:hypothetical protein
MVGLVEPPRLARLGVLRPSRTSSAGSHSKAQPEAERCGVVKVLAFYVPVGVVTRDWGDVPLRRDTATHLRILVQRTDACE